MAWTTAKGFNFRATVGYVTDPTNTVFVDGFSSNVYPTLKSIGGEDVTFGWIEPPSTPIVADANRSTSIPRLAGVHVVTTTDDTRQFRVDLPGSGDYRVTLAMGDMSSGLRAFRFALYDDTSQVWEITRTVTTVRTFSGEFLDMIDTVHLAANFFANQTPQDLTFGTTTFLLEVGGQGTNNGTTRIAHLNIEELGGDIEQAIAGSSDPVGTWGAVLIGGNILVSTAGSTTPVGDWVEVGLGIPGGQSGSTWAVGVWSPTLLSDLDVSPTGSSQPVGAWTAGFFQVTASPTGSSTPVGSWAASALGVLAAAPTGSMQPIGVWRAPTVESQPGVISRARRHLRDRRQTPEDESP